MVSPHRPREARAIQAAVLTLAFLAAAIGVGASDGNDVGGGDVDGWHDDGFRDGSVGGGIVLDGYENGGIRGGIILDEPPLDDDDDLWSAPRPGKVRNGWDGGGRWSAPGPEKPIYNDWDDDGWSGDKPYKPSSPTIRCPPSGTSHNWGGGGGYHPGSNGDKSGKSGGGGDGDGRKGGGGGKAGKSGRRTLANWRAGRRAPPEPEPRSPPRRSRPPRNSGGSAGKGGKLDGIRGANVGKGGRPGGGGGGGGDEPDEPRRSDSPDRGRSGDDCEEAPPSLGRKSFPSKSVSGDHGGDTSWRSGKNPAKGPTAWHSPRVTKRPTWSPSWGRSPRITERPTWSPSWGRSPRITKRPTWSPSWGRSPHITKRPTWSPSWGSHGTAPGPTRRPTWSPAWRSPRDTDRPTWSPSWSPSTENPTVAEIGTPEPSRRPTRRPRTKRPTRRPSRRPTPEPTLEPTPDPTPAPTPCRARRWWFNGDKCSNYPPEDGGDVYEFDTVAQCCEEIYPNGSCSYEDTCDPFVPLGPTRDPTPRPTGRPTERPTKIPTKFPTERPTRRPTRRPTDDPTREPTPSPTRCEARRWWFDGDKCSNYPPEDGNAGVFEFDNVKQCCAEIFGNDDGCNYEDMCNTLVPPEPTPNPTRRPTERPTERPTKLPTKRPTRRPTKRPTRNPTSEPSPGPTPSPTRCEVRRWWFDGDKCSNYPPENGDEGVYEFDTMRQCCDEIFGHGEGCAHEDLCDPFVPPDPTRNPTRNPARNPTRDPSRAPTRRPTRIPTGTPARDPSFRPTRNPTPNPTNRPTDHPTKSPIPDPTTHPTKDPTNRPTRHPTYRPTRHPTKVPTKNPSYRPTRFPTREPTTFPTKYPTSNPTEYPTKRPVDIRIPPQPTDGPTEGPSESPTEAPATPAPTSCEGRGWHYSPAIHGCANDDDVHPNEEGAFDTLERCCEAVFGPDEDCDYYDKCAPTTLPTLSPSENPTRDPSRGPTRRPTRRPTRNPTEIPTELPIVSPTRTPSLVPTGNPTGSPTRNPVRDPTEMPVREPTERPSASPTLLPTTPSPTGCEGRKWHFSPEVDGCANNDDLDPDDEMAFDTLEECCRAEFDSRTCDGYDMCAPTAAPATSPSTEPSAGPATPSPTPCEGRKWHYAPKIDGCANADNFVPDELAFDSLEGCCEAIGESAESCNSHDVCAPAASPSTGPTNSPTRHPTESPAKNPTGGPTKSPTVNPTSPPTESPTKIPTESPTASPATPSPTPCEERRWWFDGDRCSNHPPGEGDGGGFEGVYLHDNLQRCCEDNFRKGECQFRDVCNPRNAPAATEEPTADPSRSPTREPTERPSASPTLLPTTPSPTICEGRKWHFSPEVDGCANNDDLDPDDEMAFDTLEECCRAEFNSRTCDSYDMCAPTTFPTASPSKKPTVPPSTKPYPSQSPTEIPTESPTDSPATSSPTPCEGRKWHYAPKIDGCANTDNVVPDDLAYGSLEECCEAEFGSESCNSHDMCAPAAPPTTSPTASPSGKPTGIPTEPPTDSPATSSPTPCEGRKWYYSPRIKGCANSDDIDPEDELAFDTLEECCEREFYGVACVSYDVCAPTASPSPPADSPATSSPTPCEGRKWYYSPRIEGCANSDDIDPEDELAFDTLEECCEREFYGVACVSYDVCAPTASPSPPAESPATSSPTPCEGRKWYYSPRIEGCANSDDIDPEDELAFDTLEECCEREFYGVACVSHDVCAPAASTASPSERPTDSPSGGPTTPSPTACEGRKWHPNKDFTVCTNVDVSSNDVFDTLQDCDEYDTLQECCEGVFGPGEDCEYEDVCSTISPTTAVPVAPTPDLAKSPTRKPSRSPTQDPTREPSKRPTKSPANTPATPSSVACEGRKWHYSPRIDGCVNTDDIDPEDEMAYDTLEGCCLIEFPSETCNSHDVCAPTASPSLPSPTDSPATPSSVACEERKWHYSPQIEGCANTDDIDPDDDMAYNTLEECCSTEFPSETCNSYDMCAPVAPSSKPTTPVPSLSPTMCRQRKWRIHPTRTSAARMCTNGHGTPELGNDADVVYYNDLDECCMAAFFGKKCMYDDVCKTTPAPTPYPSTEAPTTPSPTSCEGRKWHVDYDPYKCTNAAETMSNDFSGSRKEYATLQECCEDLFSSGEGCDYDDVCEPLSPIASPMTPSPIACEGRKWHSNFDSTKCTNVAEAMSNDFAGGREEYDTLQECCEDLFASGEGCDYEDVCEPLSPKASPTTPSPIACEGRKWHPNFDSTKCTNVAEAMSNDFAGGREEYDTLQECCEDLFASGEGCDYEDVCEPPSPIASPTTPSPIACDGRKWHPNYDSTKCTNVAEAMSNDFAGGREEYDTLQECCEDLFASGEGCHYEDVCEPLSPIASPTTPSPIACDGRKWHPNYDSTKCTNVAEAMSKDFAGGREEYDTLQECCEDLFVSGEGCDYEDVCNPPSPSVSPTTLSPAGCEGRKWHPNYDSTKCTNIAEAMSNDFAGGREEYATLQECCVDLFAPGEECDFEDACEPFIPPEPTPAPTSCRDRKWHIHKTKGGFTVCYNGNNGNGAPPIADITYYDRLDQCCTAEFPEDKCRYRDECISLSPTPYPTTSAPTFGSTPTVSKETSGPPTKVPDRIPMRWGNGGWAGDSRGGDRRDKHSDSSSGNGNDAHNKCKEAEREACCNQPKSRSAEYRTRICDMLGCNLKKCGKGNDAL